MAGRRYIFNDGEPAVNVCPYGIWVCKRALTDACPIVQKVSKENSFQGIKEVAEKALKCSKRGDDLTRQQYNAKKLGVLA